MVIDGACAASSIDLKEINIYMCISLDLFVGQLKSSLICESCGYCSVTYDPFWDLSLPIPGSRGARSTYSSPSSTTIDECFKLFVREETLEGDESPVSACWRRSPCLRSWYDLSYYTMLLCSRNVFHSCEGHWVRPLKKDLHESKFWFRAEACLELWQNNDASLRYNADGFWREIGSADVPCLLHRICVFPVQRCARNLLVFTMKLCQAECQGTGCSSRRKTGTFARKLALALERDFTIPYFL